MHVHLRVSLHSLLSLGRPGLWLQTFWLYAKHKHLTEEVVLSREPEGSRDEAQVGHKTWKTSTEYEVGKSKRRFGFVVSFFERQMFLLNSLS